ncbi:MATE family efflux transporter [Clostridium sp. MB40-C1]|uniref:MATE family efflux transporter n=1 Tax=Clostridium sp. MB40-C1 TaxID=3070996 RepID=UPI0027DFC434|nr:MATE family efflux transporter [Clostridium sp. MB40-C1]WMJ81524.1 MATE family efflux transporter [Clostridium sp. MB40-C1]
MKVHQTDFGSGSVAKSILDVALPITLAQILNLLYNIVDRIYIGHIPEIGDLALTGVGLCFPIITLIMAFGMLFGSNGGAPLCSVQMGKGDSEEAEKIMGNSFSLLLLTGFIITVIGLIFAKTILYTFGASEITYSYAYDYLKIYLLGSIDVTITLGMNPFINSQGFGRTGMMTVVIGAALNIILDPIFIFGLHMGVKGAAIATVISQMVSAIWIIRFLTGKYAVLKLNWSNMKIEWERVKEITKLGFSGFVMGITTSIGQVVCNKMAFLYGGDLYVGIMTVLNSVREIFSTPLMGFGGGAVPVMSFNYGKGAYFRVKKAISFVTWCGVVFACIVWLLVICFPAMFIQVFNNTPELIQAGIPAIRIYFFGFFLMALHSTGQNTFIALCMAKEATFYSLLRKVFIVIPLTILLPHLWNLGVQGVFLAEPISNVIGGLACYLAMRRKVQVKLREPIQDTLKA